MKWIALDIGGANLKIADGRGFAQTYPFPLWKRHDDLEQTLRRLITGHAPDADRVAVTMTGELADCFDTKAQGVEFILNAVTKASDGRPARVYLTDGRLVTPTVAMKFPDLAAASNWRALATYACRMVGNNTSLLIDLGSTTCDIIPLVNGQPGASGGNDTQRLISGELVYTGVSRSPICGLLDTVVFRGQRCRVAQEFFATTRDVYLLMGKLPERPNDIDTADGKPATLKHAKRRLARMVCGDDVSLNARDVAIIAQAASDMQIARITSAARQVADTLPGPPQAVLFSGQGDFLCRRIFDRLKWPNAKMFSVARRLGRVLSTAATAHALAVLAAEAHTE